MNLAERGAVMSKGEASAKRVIALAYFHRYGWIATMIGLALIKPKLALYSVSICAIAFSLWSLIGYKLKWRHIYCSFQNAYHKTMTPHSIHWSQIKKSDAYGVPLIFLVLGIGLLIASILG